MYVRIWLPKAMPFFSPTSCDNSSFCLLAASSNRRALRMRMAVSRLRSWERSFWQATTMPVGKCVIRTAESAVFTPCPPGPDER